MKVEHDHYHKVHKAAASLFRHLLLAWFIAATVEFLLLPAELKTMNGLKALGGMSFPRLLIITGIVLAVLLIFLSVEKDIGKKQAEIAARREK